MSRKPRIFPTTLFIACEGQSTEPNYFERIKEEVEETGLFAVTIYPDNREKDNKTDPIGLIRECQKRIEVFDEVWAVYDKNGYEKHKEAIELANQSLGGKRVNIAFSSISFEIWILLHFEKKIPEFQKSDCKNQQEKYIDCGTKTNPGDCNGTNCVAGYLRSKNFYPGYSKKRNLDIYPHLKPHTRLAILNAAWLEKDLPANYLLYNQNPFSNVSSLISRLFQINVQYKWGNLNTEYQISNLVFQLSVSSELATVHVQNRKERALVLNEIEIYFINIEGLSQKLKFANHVLLIDEEMDISGVIPERTNLILIKVETTQFYFEL
jgi:hypothetical protein